jgi:hypothetical protein
MRIFLSLFFLFLLTGAGVAQETVKLQWKLDPGEQLKYRTIMNSLNESSVSFDFSQFLETTEEDGEFRKLETMLSNLSKAFENIDFESVLSLKDKNVVEVLIQGLPMNEEEAEDDSMSQLLTGVQLRGSVYTDGGIHSFWVKSSQKNLIALLFELPKVPVSLGDSWPLEVNFISNDQNFECTKSEKWGRAELVGLEKQDGETVAVIRYDFREMVQGSFNMPALAGEAASKPLSMNFTHHAIARFSVDRGRWIVYDGLMTLVAEGMLNSDQKTKLTLLPQE